MAFSAMFAYAFNLTLVSGLVSRTPEVAELVKRAMGKRVLRAISKVSRGGNRFVSALSKDINMKKTLVELAMIQLIAYGAISAYKTVSLPWVKLPLSVLVISAFLASISRILKRMRIGVKRSRSVRTFLLLIRLLLLYVITAPLFEFVRTILRGGAPRSLFSLESVLLTIPSLVLAYELSNIISKLTNRLLEKVAETSE